MVKWHLCQVAVTWHILALTFGTRSAQHSLEETNQCHSHWSIATTVTAGGNASAKIQKDSRPIRCLNANALCECSLTE